jgi:coenzyme F420-reducing hydrogenase delta subunit
MTVKEIMERVGITETGKAVAYIKDALEELNIESETHLRTERFDITEDKRFYNMPNEAIQIKDIRVKNHLNSKDEYRKIPRLLYKPVINDSDNT